MLTKGESGIESDAREEEEERIPIFVVMKAVGYSCETTQEVTELVQRTGHEDMRGREGRGKEREKRVFLGNLRSEVLK